MGLWIEKSVENGSVYRLSAASQIYEAFILISDSQVLIILEKFKKMLYWSNWGLLQSNMEMVGVHSFL